MFKKFLINFWAIFYLIDRNYLKFNLISLQINEKKTETRRINFFGSNLLNLNANFTDFRILIDDKRKIILFRLLEE